MAEGHHPGLRTPLIGWLGHADPFAFEPSFRPAAGIAASSVGTPSILAMAALEVGIDIALRAPMPLLRAKSERLAGILVEQAGLEDALPRDVPRGSQVSFRHPDAHAIVQALIGRGVIGDFRPPDLIRFGLAPLYLRYVDAWGAAEALRDLVSAG